MYRPDETKKEFIGIISEMLGGSRLKVEKKDGTSLTCRIPGRLKAKHISLRVGDIVVVRPWEVEPDKGDVVYRYKKETLPFLKAKGLL